MYTFRDSDTSIVVIDPSGRNHSTVRRALAQYKTRWNESLADKIGISSDPKEAIGSTIIIPEFMSYQINALNYKKVITIDVIQNISMYELRRAVIEPIVHTFTDITEFISAVEERNPSIAAFDFETASKWTSLQKAQFKEQLEIHEPDTEDYIWLQQQIKSDGLSHPSLVRITHLSVAVSETESFVTTISLESEVAICEWLISIDIVQIWHNISFDAKLIKHRVGKFPKHYEDTQLMWYVILNHADSTKAKTGLKHLAAKVYGSWSVGKDSFTLEHMHDPELIHYAGIDTCGTMFLYNKAMLHPDFQGSTGTVDIEQLLPAPNPKDVANRKSRRYFYENVIKNLIEPTVDLMLQGITVDFDAINDLKKVIDGVLKDVHDKLHSNEIIIDFRKHWFQELSQKKQRELESKKRDVRYYLKEYKHTDLVMRSFVVNTYLEDVRANYKFFPDNILPNKDVAWAVNDLKKFIKNNLDLPMLQEIVDKTIPTDNEWVHRAMIKLATYKAENYNHSYDEKIDEIDMSIVPLFKPGSAPQKVALFQYLNIPCEAQSKTTGVDSWGREEVERVQKETDNQDIKDLCQIFIDYSFSKIIRSNFLAAFDTFVVDGKLHGNYRLMGAKTGRYTSNSPNMLNAPSTGSIYAKPLKKCFVAPKGKVIVAADYNALEDRILAAISEDKNKLKILLDGLDSHCFNSMYYFRKEIEAILGPINTSAEFNKIYKDGCDSDKRLKAIRQKGKPVTFGMAYGSYPPKIASTIKCSLEEAQGIFNAYHNELYAGVKDYTENYIRKQAEDTGEVYLFSGLRIKTDDPDKHIRTINNASIQTYSILSAIAFATMAKRIKDAGYEQDIQLTSSIYDSVYYEVTADPIIIEWMNRTLVEVMTTPFMDGSAIENDSGLEIGPNWADLVEIPNNCSIEYIKGVLSENM